MPLDPFTIVLALFGISVTLFAVGFRLFRKREPEAPKAPKYDYEEVYHL